MINPPLRARLAARALTLGHKLAVSRVISQPRRQHWRRTWRSRVCAAWDSLARWRIHWLDGRVSLIQFRSQDFSLLAFAFFTPRRGGRVDSYITTLHHAVKAGARPFAFNRLEVHANYVAAITSLDIGVGGHLWGDVVADAKRGKVRLRARSHERSDAQSSPSLRQHIANHACAQSSGRRITAR